MLHISIAGVYCNNLKYTMFKNAPDNLQHMSMCKKTSWSCPTFHFTHRETTTQQNQLSENYNRLKGISNSNNCSSINNIFF